MDVKFNSGFKVTLYSLILMLASIIVVLLGLKAHSFVMFFAAFLLLFLTTGFVNGAFLIPKIFDRAYSNFEIVKPAFYVLIGFTVITIVITWFSGIKC